MMMVLGLIGAAAIGSIPTAEAQQKAVEAAQVPNNGSMMVIDPKARALDFQQAYEMLRKEKTANKVQFMLINGKTISNIIDMTILSNGSLILFKFNSPQGIKFQVIPIESIEAITHS